MPRAAVELGVADQVLPLDQIPAALVRAVQPPSRPLSTAATPVPPPVSIHT
jgi:hypothetical protein